MKTARTPATHKMPRPIENSPAYAGGTEDSVQCRRGRLCAVSACLVAALALSNMARCTGTSYPTPHEVLGEVNGARFGELHRRECSVKRKTACRAGKDEDMVLEDIRFVVCDIESRELTFVDRKENRASDRAAEMLMEAYSERTSQQSIEQDRSSQEHRGPAESPEPNELRDSLDVSELRYLARDVEETGKGAGKSPAEAAAMAVTASIEKWVVASTGECLESSIVATFILEVLHLSNEHLRAVSEMQELVLRFAVPVVSHNGNWVAGTKSSDYVRYGMLVLCRRGECYEAMRMWLVMRLFALDGRGRYGSHRLAQCTEASVASLLEEELPGLDTSVTTYACTEENGGRSCSSVHVRAGDEDDYVGFGLQREEGGGWHMLYFYALFTKADVDWESLRLPEKICAMAGPEFCTEEHTA